MELTDVLKQVGGACDFVETSNYYYNEHICTKNGQNIKVRLDYTLMYDVDDNIIRFGVCEGCKTCFYHKDFRSDSL